MQYTEVEKRFNEVCKGGKCICTKDEFDYFQNYGYLIPSGELYVNRMGNKLSVDIIDTKIKGFNIDISSLITSAFEKSKYVKCNRIYYMTENTYDKYMQLGFIVEKDGNKYFRYYENELWYIIIL